mmetsp:Transcript_35937/g.64291  ORF Transcript_35937/g.64291 Transcript_35937/m.64291 type:complete len:222 (+) Transcript_35937:537-1202(+)
MRTPPPQPHCTAYKGCFPPHGLGIATSYGSDDPVGVKVALGIHRRIPSYPFLLLPRPIPHQRRRSLGTHDCSVLWYLSGMTRWKQDRCTPGLRSYQSALSTQRVAENVSHAVRHAEDWSKASVAILHEALRRVPCCPDLDTPDAKRRDRTGCHIDYFFHLWNRLLRLGDWLELWDWPRWLWLRGWKLRVPARAWAFGAAALGRLAGRAGPSSSLSITSVAW